jgi:hypothetical protein
MEPDYTYEAGNVGGKTWMVKRFTIPKTPEGYTEALIESEYTNPEQVIEQAIARGSWA